MPNGSSRTTSTTSSVESKRMVRRFLPSFQLHHSHLIYQELAPSTLLIQSDHMSVRPVELPVLLSPSSSPSSTIRQVSFTLLLFSILLAAHFLIPFAFGTYLSANLTELYPNLNHLMELPSKTLTRCIPFIDILQEPSSGSRNHTPSAFITPRRVVNRD
jgi:hypothetical protein